MVVVVSVGEVTGEERERGIGGRGRGGGEVTGGERGRGWRGRGVGGAAAAGVARDRAAIASSMVAGREGMKGCGEEIEEGREGGLT